MTHRYYCTKKKSEKNESQSVSLSPPPTLAPSLSLHRPPYLCIPLTSRFIHYNKQTKLRRRRPGTSTAQLCEISDYHIIGPLCWVSKNDVKFEVRTMMIVCMLLQCLYRFHGPIPLKIALKEEEFRTCGNTSTLYKCAQVMGVKCSHVLIQDIYRDNTYFIHPDGNP